MRQFGVIGRPLIHSFSPSYFAKKFSNENIQASYSPFELESIQELPSFLEQKEQLEGFNVTIPYKEKIIPYLHEVDEDAQAIGAVNVVGRNGNAFKGFNTDFIGFKKSLLTWLQFSSIKKAIILGTGGSSKAVSYALKQLDIPFILVSRNGKGNDAETINYAALNKMDISAFQLIVNTTPLGSFPNVEEYPDFPFDKLTASHHLYDLIYNPSETAFLKRGKQRGAATKNGLEMLHIQAEASWDLWNQNNRD